MTRSVLVALAVLLLAGCSVTGRVYCEHARGPNTAGASIEWRNKQCH